MDKMRMESIDMTEQNIRKSGLYSRTALRRRKMRTASQRRLLILTCCGRCCPAM